MPTDKHSSKQSAEPSRPRRSRRVSLSLVPALAALVGTSACSSRSNRTASSIYDPCEQTSYVEIACDSAVTQQGYYYNGTWYAHSYPYSSLYYYNRYTGFIASGGHVRGLSPTVYVPHTSTPIARPSVVRGGFGSIGAGHGAAGS